VKLFFSFYSDSDFSFGKTHFMKHLKRYIGLPILLLGFSFISKSQSAYQLLKTFHIKSPGGWDYLAIGPDNRLYVSHGTQVNILDKTTGDSVGIIENTTGVHGIAFNKELSRGYTSNGRLNNVTVFDLPTHAVITQINTGENPDAILFEPYSGKIITCNGRSNNLSVIDPASNKVIATIPVGGKPETAVSNGKGLLYVNVEDKSEVVAVDTKNFTVLHHWSVSPGEEPTGLAFDKSTNRLFAGCGNKLLIVLNASDGTVIEKINIGNGCDGVAFDAERKTVFASNGEGSLSVITEKSANKFENIATVPTHRGARTITVDPSTHLVYLPTAEFEPADTPNGRPKMIPGTFQVLVMGKN
jgi:YVTN family beta-propeller protein